MKMGIMAYVLLYALTIGAVIIGVPVIWQGITRPCSTGAMCAFLRNDLNCNVAAPG